MSPGCKGRPPTRAISRIRWPKALIGPPRTCAPPPLARAPPASERVAEKGLRPSAQRAPSSTIERRCPSSKATCTPVVAASATSNRKLGKTDYISRNRVPPNRRRRGVRYRPYQDGGSVQAQCDLCFHADIWPFTERICVHRSQIESGRVIEVVPDRSRDTYPAHASEFVKPIFRPTTRSPRASLLLRISLTTRRRPQDHNRETGSCRVRLHAVQGENLVGSSR